MPKSVTTGSLHGRLRGHDSKHRHESRAVVRRARRTTNGVTRIVVAAAVIGVLDDLDLDYLKVSDSKLKELAVAQKELLAGK
jgi:hypothetical protein